MQEATDALNRFYRAVYYAYMNVHYTYVHVCTYYYPEHCRKPTFYAGYANLLKFSVLFLQFPNGAVACVSDSYDIW